MLGRKGPQGLLPGRRSADGEHENPFDPPVENKKGAPGPFVHHADICKGTMTEHPLRRHVLRSTCFHLADLTLTAAASVSTPAPVTMVTPSPIPPLTPAPVIPGMNELSFLRVAGLRVEERDER